MLFAPCIYSFNESASAIRVREKNLSEKRKSFIPGVLVNIFEYSRVSTTRMRSSLTAAFLTFQIDMLEVRAAI